MRAFIYFLVKYIYFQYYLFRVDITHNKYKAMMVVKGGARTAEWRVESKALENIAVYTIIHKLEVWGIDKWEVREQRLEKKHIESFTETFLVLPPPKSAAPSKFVVSFNSFSFVLITMKKNMTMNFHSHVLVDDDLMTRRRSIVRLMEFLMNFSLLFSFWSLSSMFIRRLHLVGRRRKSKQKGFFCGMSSRPPTTHRLDVLECPWETKTTNSIYWRGSHFQISRIIDRFSIFIDKCVGGRKIWDGNGIPSNSFSDIEFRQFLKRNRKFELGCSIFSWIHDRYIVDGNLLDFVLCRRVYENEIPRKMITFKCVASK